MGTALVPDYLCERDYPWLRQLIEEFLRFKGQTRRELIRYFSETHSPQAYRKKRDLAFHLLHQMSEDDKGSRKGVKSTELRKAIFESAASAPVKPDPSDILSNVALTYQLKTSVDVLDQAFSDLPLERRIVKMPEDLTSQQLALRTNLALLQGLISRSSEVEIEARGSIRRIIRQSKLRRLIFQVETQDTREPLIRISGPLSLFGHTQIYGRALAELVPLLPWCDHFRLSAVCRVHGKEGILEVHTGAPIPPASEPRHYDSKVEARFARDFAPYMKDWELIREPEPLTLKPRPSDPSRLAGGSLIFPDFQIRHRRNPHIQFYVEIVGFWTPDYLSRKLAQADSVTTDHLLLCVDESLACEEARAQMESTRPIIFYRKSVRMEDLMARARSAFMIF